MVSSYCCLSQISMTLTDAVSTISLSIPAKTIRFFGISILPFPSPSNSVNPDISSTRTSIGTNTLPYRRTNIFGDNADSRRVQRRTENNRRARRRIDPLDRRIQQRRIAGIDVEFFEDYKKSIKHNLISGNNEKIKLPKSNVIIFRLIDNSMIALRPSGTEPKIKYYISVNNIFDSNKSWFKQKKVLEKKIEIIKKEFINL